jgi:hypothetical protein
LGSVAPTPLTMSKLSEKRLEALADRRGLSLFEIKAALDGRGCLQIPLPLTERRVATLDLMDMARSLNLEYKLAAHQRGQALCPDQAVGDQAVARVFEVGAVV